MTACVTIFSRVLRKNVTRKNKYFINLGKIVTYVTQQAKNVLPPYTLMKSAFQRNRCFSETGVSKGEYVIICDCLLATCGIFLIATNIVCVYSVILHNITQNTPSLPCIPLC